MNEILTEAWRILPALMCENVLENWIVEKQGYDATCWNCGKKIWLG